MAIHYALIVGWVWDMDQNIVRCKNKKEAQRVAAFHNYSPHAEEGDLVSSSVLTQAEVEEEMAPYLEPEEEPDASWSEEDIAARVKREATRQRLREWLAGDAVCPDALQAQDVDGLKATWYFHCEESELEA